MNQKSYALFSTPLNKTIISKLRENGAKVFLIPNIRTSEIVFESEIKVLLKNAVNYDWIIFTDVFTVDYFIEFLNSKEIDLFDLDQVRICAFGEAVADRLRFSEIHADIISNKIETEKIFALLNDYLSFDCLQSLTFLVLKEKSKNIELTKKLKSSAFADVKEIDVYKILEFEKTATTKLKALLTGGAIDEIIFSDPSDLVGFKFIFSDTNKQNIFSDVRFSAFNEVMFQMLVENGFHPTFFQEK